VTYDHNHVHHAALENRGAGQLALHLHFQRPHDRMTLGQFFGDLAAFMQGQDGILMRPEFHKDGAVISLVPLQPTSEIRYFEAASRHLGFEPPKGELPFMQEGSCFPINGTSRMEH
jgi:hypothetical protein